MRSLSYKIILACLFLMLAASLLLFADTATLAAYIMLATGFFGIGIGLLIGFFTMVREPGGRNSNDAH